MSLSRKRKQEAKVAADNLRLLMQPEEMNDEEAIDDTPDNDPLNNINETDEIGPLGLKRGKILGPTPTILHEMPSEKDADMIHFFVQCNRKQANKLTKLVRRVRSRAVDLVVNNICHAPNGYVEGIAAILAKCPIDQSKLEDKEYKSYISAKGPCRVTTDMFEPKIPFAANSELCCLLKGDRLEMGCQLDPPITIPVTPQYPSNAKHFSVSNIVFFNGPFPIKSKGDPYDCLSELKKEDPSVKNEGKFGYWINICENGARPARETLQLAIDYIWIQTYSSNINALDWGDY